MWAHGRPAAGGDPTASYEAAIQANARAIEMNPSLWQPRMNQGLVYRSMNRCAEALRAFDSALAVNPTHPELQQFIREARRELEREW